jgi:hypothetical protein
MLLVSMPLSLAPLVAIQQTHTHANAHTALCDAHAGAVSRTTVVRPFDQTPAADAGVASFLPSIGLAPLHLALHTYTHLCTVYSWRVGLVSLAGG